MDLSLEFLICLLKNGYSKRDIRITISLETAKTIKITSKISNELNINRGTLHSMKHAKRRTPLDIAEYFGIKYTGNLSLKNSNIEVKVPKFLNNNLAYLCGVLRDGTVAREGKNEYTVAFYSKSKEFVEKLAELVYNEFGIKQRIERMDEVWGIRIRSLVLYEFFRLMFEVPKYQKDWNTPKIIEKSSREVIRNYISGFWDAEGSCSHIEKMKSPKKKNLSINITQKNIESLEFIKSVLEKEGIETGKIYTNDRKSMFRISRKCIPKFCNYIVSRHKLKSKRLQVMSEIFSIN